MVELHQTGIDRLLTLVNLEPGNEKAYFNLGMITMDEVCMPADICRANMMDHHIFCDFQVWTFRILLLKQCAKILARISTFISTY